MSKLIKRLETRFASFDADKIREQLILAYQHMFVCAQALRGEEVEPVELDDEENIGEELFYLCKKKSLEESRLVELSGKNLMDDAQEFLDGFSRREIIIPGSKARQFVKEFARKARFSVGEKVYYYNGGIRHSVIETIEYEDEVGWSVGLENGTILRGFDGLFRTREGLVAALKKEVRDE